MVNITRPMLPTRFETIVTVEFSVNPLRVKRVLLAAMRALEEVPGFDDQKMPEVLVKDTSSSGVEYLLRYWIRPWDPISPTKAEDQVMTSVLQQLHTAGIALAYPKTDLYYAPMPVRQYDGHHHEDLVALLAQLKLFEPLAPRDLEEISESMERHHLQAGETLVREGDKGKSLFVLIEGLLDAFVERGGHEEPVGRIRPGNCLGEMSLLTGERRTATVRAATEAIVYEISKKPLRHIMERNPMLAEKLAQLLAEHQLETEQALHQAEKTQEGDSMDSFTASLVRRMRVFLDLQRSDD
jgi:CRP-like cAMP-binding protein